MTAVQLNFFPRSSRRGEDSETLRAHRDAFVHPCALVTPADGEVREYQVFLG